MNRPWTATFPGEGLGMEPGSEPSSKMLGTDSGRRVESYSAMVGRDGNRHTSTGIDCYRRRAGVQYAAQNPLYAGESEFNTHILFD